jgi:DNA gyrase/topoisomerase IV subunit A
MNKLGISGELNNCAINCAGICYTVLHSRRIKMENMQDFEDTNLIIRDLCLYQMFINERFDQIHLELDKLSDIERESILKEHDELNKKLDLIQKMKDLYFKLFTNPPKIYDKYGNEREIRISSEAIKNNLYCADFPKAI